MVMNLNPEIIPLLSKWNYPSRQIDTDDLSTGLSRHKGKYNNKLLILRT